MSASDFALLLAGAATLISLAAAAFTLWQALIANKAQKAENERALVEWEPASWPEPDTIELRSKGPDDARSVWARMTIDGAEVVTEAKQVRSGEALRFRFPQLAVTWEVHELLAAGPGDQWNDVSAFGWGVLVTWESQYGKSDTHRDNGWMRRRVRYDQPPNPYASGMPGAPI